MKSPTYSACASPGLLAALWPLLSSAATIAPAHDGPLEQIIVVAPHGATIDRDRLPAYVQSATAEDIERADSLDLTDFLNRNFSSVHINHAQNNPLQPDLNFRGFTASPLLGLPQGMAVYQDGMRANEPFGDAVNWDLIPLSAIESVQLLAGSNPVFGLNTLGGALVVQMKTGFDASGTSLDAYAGSFGRRGATLQTGANDGRWGYYFNVDYFEEDGWRDHSASDALRGYGALSLHTDATTLDLRLSHATSDLRGNGASPVELLALDRAAVFTYPDVTENRLTQLIVDATQRLDDRTQLAANAYVRAIDTDTFNGDGTIFEE
jgi:iron complex outermembrane receptor protein